MASQDDLTLLKQMYQRGEISDEQYDALRRHVLWGTPLPHLVDELPTPGPPAPAPPRPTPPRSSPQGREPWAAGSPGRSAPVSGSSGPRSPGAGASAPAPPLAGSPMPGAPAPGPAGGGSPGRGSRAVGSPGRRPVSGLAGPGAPWRPDRGFVPDRPERPAQSGPQRARTAYDAGLPPARQNARPRDLDATGDLGAPLPADDLDRGEPAPRRRRPDPAPAAEPDRSRRPRQRGIAAVLTSLLLALALAAAGVWWFALRETGVDAPTYARSVCGSVRDWQQRVDARSTALVRAIPREEDRSKVRSAVETYYRDLATLTDSLRGSVVGAGAVDVPGGRAYADSLASAVSDQAGTMRDLAARASRLDVKAGSLFETSVRALLTGAENAVSQITAALARPAAGTPAQLRLALSDEPACAPYVG